MTSGDRSKYASAIAGKFGKAKGDGDEGSSSEEASESDDDAAKESAGTEFADAIKSGDGMEIYRAFEALTEHCKGG